jgi:ethanolamine utilization protein EutN
MKLGRVVGKVWSERKTPSLDGVRLQVIQPVTTEGTGCGRMVVAADPLGIAGVGDTVVYVTNADAADAFESDAPVNASITMLVDFVV